MKNKYIQLVDKNTFNTSTLNFKAIVIISFCILSLITYLTFEVGYMVGKQNQKTIVTEMFVDKIFNKKYEDDFSEAKLIELLTKLKVKHSDIVLAQAKIESSHYKSQLFVENNNLFGMRLPKSRITTAIGSDLGHAKYENWRDSVIDYAIYQSTYLSKYNRKEYLTYLKSNYAENADYVSLINKMIK